MADGSGAELPKLSELLEEGWRILEAGDPGGPEGIREVQRGVKVLEEATRMVTQLDLFSSNEDLEEISSADLRFLLLPALLGALTLKQGDQSRRLQHLEAARTYFLDFLKRCHRYKVSDFTLPPQPRETGENEGYNPPDPQSNLTAIAVHRQAKIERYKQKKSLEGKLAVMKEAVKSGRAEEEQIREFYLLHLRQWVCTALEEVDSIDQEIPLVKAREMIKKGEELARPPRISRPPMKPFILTRDALQAKVFGAGYPSLPTMTVDDWYESHLSKGVLPDQGVHSKPRDEEEEAAERERKVESDDPEALQHARNWDKWKDTHPRGYGNRKNMG
ncbi:immunoglobulin-binding protein 1 [Rana temporaria]|uniref:immunoglobulin-binding protein 1 n=1 Tax=Rana temporaria TaxID=8407 RepID=UPI001AAD45A5|nr:immunoglobulin-binding protein 1 [Rana temporaria]